MDELTKFMRHPDKASKLVMTADEAKEVLAGLTRRVCRNCTFDESEHLDSRCMFGPGTWELDLERSEQEY